MLKLALKFIAGLAGLVVLLVGAYIGYLALTYIDETVVEGTSYGYTIGQSKREAFSVAQQQFRRGAIAGLHVSDPFESFAPDEPHWGLLESNDRWTLFFSEEDNFFNTLKLKFTGDQLEEIHRHRQYFELP
jgi:hypothetical protein